MYIPLRFRASTWRATPSICVRTRVPPPPSFATLRQAVREEKLQLEEEKRMLVEQIRAQEEMDSVNKAEILSLENQLLDAKQVSLE